MISSISTRTALGIGEERQVGSVVEVIQDCSGMESVAITHSHNYPVESNNAFCCCRCLLEDKS